MSYSLVYTHRAAKDIGSLDHLVQKKLAGALRTLANDPLLNAKKLINTKIGSYRLRVGDYRVVFDLHGNKIVVLRVGHRREVYR